MAYSSLEEEMKVLVLDYSDRDVERYAKEVKRLGYEAHTVRNAAEALGTLFGHSHTLDASFGALIAGIQTRNWSGQAWHGLWLFGHLQKLKVEIPCLAHCEVSSYAGYDLHKLPSRFSFVTFQVKDERVEYIPSFLSSAAHEHERLGAFA